MNDEFQIQNSAFIIHKFSPHREQLLQKHQLSQAKSVLPKVFKGIALFTPGGDLIYCIDPKKQERWHLHLCAGLQEILGLPEPPHFLVPCYTATIDCWLNPRNGQVQIFAEAYPLVLRHQALLNAVFEIKELVWQAAPWSEGLCDPMVLATNRSLFPQLWQDHNLIVRYSLSHNQPKLRLKSDLVDRVQKTHLQTREDKETQIEKLSLEVSPTSPQFNEQTLGYVLRLFVAGHSANTERILQTLHQLLEQSLHRPYTLKVVDVFKHPEQAEADSVSATPTLVKVSPLPMRKLVGDLDNAAKILQMLASPEG